MQRIALVTGANRGIGFEICRQFAQLGIKVILTARDETKGREATRKLQNEGLDITFHLLDVTDDKSIQSLTEWVEQTFTRVDILVNNAGIFVDKQNTALQPDIEKIRQTMETNVYGPLRLCETIIPLMHKNRYGRIINVSSGVGSFQQATTGQPGYRISKVALNMLTKLLANELRDVNITVNSVTPGWVRTDMGSPNAERSVEEATDTIVWLATECTATGKFLQDRKEIDW